MLALPSTIGRLAAGYKNPRAYLNINVESHTTGSSIWRTVGSFQLVTGPDYQRNTKRDPAAVPVDARCLAKGKRMYAALQRWHANQQQRIIRTPAVIYLDAPQTATVAPAAVADDTRPLRQLSLF